MKKRSKFNLSNFRLTTLPFGKLVPISVLDVLPGDSIRMSSSCLIRMAPMIAPIMHPITVRIHHWFVPYRILWDDFEDFITGGPKNQSLPDFPFKNLNITSTNSYSKTLYDYMGIGFPANGKEAIYSVSALPFRAYSMIWNEFYRDEDLQDEVKVSLESGYDNTTYDSLLNVSWNKDYFTTSRPWTQKGNNVVVPLVNTTGGSVGLRIEPDGAWRWDETGSASNAGIKQDQFTINNVVHKIYMPTNDTSLSNGFELGYRSGLKITGGDEGSIARAGIDILDLRLSSALQRYNENRARFGSRYPEYLQFLGVRPQDSRLQRPEYLGGGRQLLQISEVLQTSPSSTDGFVGTMKGHGIGAMRSNQWTRFFSEHGVVLTLASIVPKSLYINATDRFWFKKTREDFFQPELSHVGAQEVYNNELYPSDTSKESNLRNENTVFGYQDRYSEYRSQRNLITGDFRDSFDYWHLGRSFIQKPVLNGDFIQCKPSHRIFADQTDQYDPFLCMFNHKVKARRLVPKFANGVLK